jgi:hypothetical protein
MERNFESLDVDGEVVSVEPSSKFLTAYPMFKTDQFKANIKQLFQKYSGTSAEITEKWLGEGMSCEVLKLDSNAWQKGEVRVKFTLEFCPDEPEVEEIKQSNDAEINQTESPLDDIRRMMNKDN